MIPASLVCRTSSTAIAASDGDISEPVSTRILLGSAVITRAALVIARSEAPCLIMTGRCSSVKDPGFEGVCRDGSSRVVVISGAARLGMNEGWMGDETMDGVDREAALVRLERRDAVSSDVKVGSEGCSVEDSVGSLKLGMVGFNMDIPSVPKTLLAVFRCWRGFTVTSPLLEWTEELSVCEEAASSTVGRFRDDLPLPHKVPIQSFIEVLLDVGVGADLALRSDVDEEDTFEILEESVISCIAGADECAYRDTK